MNRPFSLSRVLLTVAMLGLIALAVIALQAQQQNSEAYDETGKENVYWSATNVEVELSRMVAVLGRFAVGERGLLHEDIVSQFEALKSRTSAFQYAETGAALRALPGEEGVIARLAALLMAHERSIQDLKPGDWVGANRLARDFAALQSDVHTLAEGSFLRQQARFAAVRENLASSTDLTFLVITAALFLITVLIGVMLIEARYYERSLRDIAQLAAEASSASRAKTRFLTMMSHELRTPMNGVLGSIALVRQAGLSDNQTRLIEQAERSGRQMTELLSDILDFSDLETERVVLDEAAIELDLFTESVVETLGQSAARRGTELSVRRSVDGAGAVIGDEVRLRQLVGHLAGYLIEVIGVEAIDLELGHADATLTIAIAVTPGARTRPGWRPDTMFEEAMDGHGTVMSDSIGPMIAWGLTRLMSGTIVTDQSESPIVSISVEIPARAVDASRDHVRVVARSATSDLLIRTAVETAGLPHWDGAADPERVATVLYESSGADESMVVAQLRAKHPGARIIGLGVVKKSPYFDGYGDIPPNPAVLLRVADAPGDAADNG